MGGMTHLEYLMEIRGGSPREEDRMDTTTETPATEGKKPRKPMSQEQKDAISKKLKSLWRKRRAEGTPTQALAPTKKGKAKPKTKLAPVTGVDARAAVERYNAAVKAAKEELRAALRRAIEEL